MRTISDEARIRYNENRRIKCAANRKTKAVCDECGSTIEVPKVNRSYCFSCSVKREDESKRRWAERNPGKVRQAKDEANRKKRERIATAAKMIPCALCGEILRKDGSQKYCHDCRPLMRTRRERRRNLTKRNIPGTHTRLEFYQLCESLNWECSYCGKQLNRETATEDHVIPLKVGGSDDLSNITPACLHCNTQKGSMTYEEYMKYERRFMVKEAVG
jgi:5-methylcytosine-specific restriction endonuclease McrA